MALTDVKSEQIQSSVALAGSPTTTTQSASDNSTKIATTAYVETAVANLVASAPAALNTLDELAAALNDDASFSTTITNSIATKLPLAGGTMSGALNMGSQNITNAGTIAGTLTTAAQSNITSVGTLTGLTVTGANSNNFASSSGGTPTTIQITGTDAYNSGYAGAGIRFGGKYHSNGNTATLAGISGIKENTTDTQYGGVLTFFTRADGSGAGSTERMRIDSSGRVGIGTGASIASAGQLHIRATTPHLYLQSNDGQSSKLMFGDASDNSRGGLEYTSSDNLVFTTNNLSEAMRIDSSGNVLIGDLRESVQGAIHSITGVSRDVPVSIMARGSSSVDHVGILNFMRTRATSGNYTATASGDRLGKIRFYGVNTSAVADIGAEIFVEQNGTSASTVPADMHFKTNEQTRMTIDKDGHVGIGATSPAATLHLRSTATGNTPSIIFENTNNAQTMDIDYYNNVGSVQSRIRYSEGPGTFQILPNAGANAAMMFLYNGNVGVNANAPLVKFTVGGASEGNPATSGTTQANASGRFFYGGACLDIGHYTSGTAWILNSSPSNLSTNRDIALQPNGGNVLVKKTSNDNTSVGISLRDTGEGSFVATGQRTALFNRLSSDGDLIEFRKDGSAVGRIASDSGSILMGSGDVGVYFDAASDRILPMNMSGAVRNDAIDIGGNPHRFKDLYLSGGVFLGGTGSSNKLDDYEEGTWSPTVYVGSTQQNIHVNRATYAKIGDFVHCTFSFYASGSNFGSSGGNVELRGFPFASSSTAEESCGSLMINLANWNGAAHTWYVIYKYSGESNDAALFYGSGDNVGWDALGANQVPQNTSFIGTITFRVFA